MSRTPREGAPPSRSRGVGGTGGTGGTGRSGRPHRPGRAGRVVGGVGVVALLAAVAATGLRLPAPASGDTGGSVVAVPPTATTLVCPGPVVLADDSAGDAAFDPAPVQTVTTQRVVTVPPSAGATGAVGGAPADPAATSVTPLAGGEALLTLDGPETVAGLGTVSGPTVLRAEPAGGRPAVTGGATASVTAQGDLRGLAAASCREPSASTWLVGGSTEIGNSALLVVANPGRTPAEVALELWGPTGSLQAAGAATFLVAPGEQRAVLLEGVAAEQRRVAVHVTAAGGLVTAHLQDSRLDGFTPAGTDLVTAGAPPATRQVVSGLVVPASTLEQTDTAVVRVLAPGEDRAAARLTVLGPDGPVALPGAESIDLGPGEVTDVSLAGLPAGAYTVVVDADTPVVAGAMLTREGDPLELGDVPTLERAWAAAVPLDTPTDAPADAAPAEGGVVALPAGVTGSVVLAAVPPVADDPVADGTGTAGGPARGVLHALGPDGTVLATQEVEVPAGRTVRVDTAALAPGGEVAALHLEVDRGTAASDGTSDSESDGGSGEASDATSGDTSAQAAGGTRLAWSVLVTSGSGTQELISVLTPAPTPDARPDVVVRAADRLGLG